jgi:hypothetical protein
MNIYEPLIEESYKEMYDVVNPITAQLPNDGYRLGVIWNNFKLITGRTDAQPCGCKSTVKYWAEAVDTLKDFIYNVELKKESLSTESKNHIE